jgi:hypothetical protein
VTQKTNQTHRFQTPRPHSAPPDPPAPDAALTDVDLHVHTLSSNCGYTSHQRLLDLTRAEGRKVVAVTDHDSAAGGVAVRDLAARSGDDILVLIGMELTTRDFGHVIVFGRGVEEDWGWRAHEPFPRHIPDHWVAIQAHPYRGKVTQTADGLQVETLPELPARIDAVEVWNGGDILKKTPRMRADLDRLSRSYIREHGKTAVASSDGHRPIWIHTFFTRFTRPLLSVDDLVQQIRAGECSPQTRDEAFLQESITRWGRREVVEWRESGKDWRAMASAAGYNSADAERLVALFDQVRNMNERGASPAEIGCETGLSPFEVADYLGVVEEESGFRARRAQRASA